MTLDVVKLNSQLGEKEPAFFLLGRCVLVVASLVIGIRCSGAISGEREKQTWEALLLTPLATQADSCASSSGASSERRLHMCSPT